tara:strand:+ start:1084 stop:1392 length:309 start_codon:yes stop_codon:yes gene_type:complete
MKTNYNITLKDKSILLNHLRGIEVKYMPPTNHKGARIKIYDTRHEVRKIISYNYSYNNARDEAIDYLMARGIEINSMTYNEKTHTHTLLTLDFATSINEVQK